MLEQDFVKIVLTDYEQQLLHEFKVSRSIHMPGAESNCLFDYGFIEPNISGYDKLNRPLYDEFFNLTVTGEKYFKYLDEKQNAVIVDTKRHRITTIIAIYGAIISTLAIAIAWLAYATAKG